MIRLAPRHWSPSYPPGKRLAVRRAQELARLPPLAGCSARELRFIARWGDLITAEPGQVLARRDHSDWWLFVVISGRLTVSNPDGKDADGEDRELGAGEQFGAEAILGLQPQRVTVTAADGCVLFVLGPRYVLSLLSVSGAFRRGLFPDVTAEDYAAYAQRMYDEGQAAWHRLAARPARAVPHQRRTAAGGLLALAPPLAPTSDRLPGRPLTLAEAVQALAALPPAPDNPAPVPGRPLRRRWLLAAGIAVLALVSAVLFGYHPPRLVLSAGRPIDVAADIRVVGAPTHDPTGHYLLLWVRATQPTLAGLLGAWVTGRMTVDYERAADESSELAAGRQQYLDSQRRAIALALAAAHADPRRVSVHIRDRGFSGPSAGLVYALAIDDLLTSADESDGRVIAVTGAILPVGRVEPIGWLVLKERGAVAGHATLLVVPAGQLDGATGWPGTACGVPSVRDAMRALAETRRDSECTVARTLSPQTGARR